MIRHQIARILTAIADRLEPEPQRTDLDQILDRLSDLVSGHIVGHGIAGRGFTPGSGTEIAY